MTDWRELSDLVAAVEALVSAVGAGEDVRSRMASTRHLLGRLIWQEQDRQALQHAARQPVRRAA